MKTIETEFGTAMQWFNAITKAVGKQKIDVIKECKDKCPEAWALLLLYLNPCNVFHIRARSLANNINAAGTPYTNIQTLLSDLMQMPAITNSKIAEIKATLNTISDESIRKFAVQFLTKCASLGVTANTVNAAIGENIIPVFSCMLANKYFDHPKAIVGKNVAVTEKLDGIRAIVFVQQWPKDADITIFSRQGKRIVGLLEIEQAIKEAIVPLYENEEIEDNLVFDGELLITDRENIPSKEQYKKTTKIVSSDKLIKKTGITYNVFDVLTQNDFRVGESEATYTERRNLLESIFANNKSSAVRVVPVKQRFNFSDEDRAFRAVMRMVTQAREDNEEGVMLNICDAHYLCKRTNNLLKVKVFQDCDLKIVDFQKGAGKFENTLGALIVDYKGNRVGVGSGLSDEMRQEFWNNQEKYLGRVVTVQYFEETNDSEGNKSIRFPVFKELREEGKEVSYQ